MAHLPILKLDFFHLSCLGSTVPLLASALVEIEEDIAIGYWAVLQFRPSTRKRPVWHRRSVVQSPEPEPGSAQAASRL